MIGRQIGQRSAALAAAAVTLALAAGSHSATAEVISQIPDRSFATLPVTITFGTSSFIFTAIPNTFPGDPPAEVSTAGSAEVTSFLGGVTDFSIGASIDQTLQLYTFSAFASPAVIPDSAADDFIGLDFTAGNALHYGYAEIAGTELISYGYETLPETTILTGAIPEPATAGLLLVGLAGIARARRWRRRSAAATTMPSGTPSGSLANA